ncbi:disintegrin and metalloproteinase domain-containing protein 9-like [Carettochelys insculpta]|uniref:disintegrin and metalloproteinase domain-containing protein 9-like n=1 Tax=Carettochelys insculpta TaxID=44489 RepID=UPI003EBB09D4
MARDEVQGPGLLLRLCISMVLLEPFLPFTNCSPQPPPGFASYEVIVPRKLSPKEGKAHKDVVSYAIKAEGKLYIVHLKQKKGFLAKNFPVFTYDARGQLRVDQSHIPDDCYYHGYVEGTPESLVALSTCFGLRGFLQIGSLNYGIEPVESSFMFQHLLYRTEVMAPKPVICGLTAADFNHQAPEMERKQVPKAEGFRPWMHTKYMELLIVVDNLRFEYAGRNITNISMQVVEVVSMVDELFYDLRLRILLTALEIWTESNPITITHNINEVLSNFNLWRQRHIYPRAPHDIGHLFVYVNFGTNIGKAYLSGVCDKTRASGVEAFMHGPMKEFAVLVAHELGHNIGMRHDDRNCACTNGSSCIMNEHHIQVHQFSSCSARDYFDLIMSGKGHCLTNVPDTQKLFNLQYCGNSIVDTGEQCDCGAKKQCEKDPCCDHTCRLKPGALCAFGKCCRKCQFLPEGRTCRAQTNECDLPEYCNGTSPWCQEDVYKQDGTLCSDNGYCFHGFCSTHNLQCQYLFGKAARAAPESCFKEVNTKGDRFGNCGGDGGEVKFEKCKLENVLCGRVQCVNVKRIPHGEDHMTFIQTPVDNVWCWGTDFHLGMEVSDVGTTEDGTKCDTNKICINHTCVNETQVLTSNCTVKKCGRRGVCNSNGNCHCNNGWAPPNCQFAGFGGSIDSGPPPLSKTGLFSFVGTILGITIAVAIVTAAVAVILKKPASKMIRRMADRLEQRNPSTRNV